jgi:hypothetical protein
VTGTGLIGANFLRGREQLAYGQNNENEALNKNLVK